MMGEMSDTEWPRGSSVSQASVKEDDALPSEPEGQTNLFHCFTGFLFHAHYWWLFYKNVVFYPLLKMPTLRHLAEGFCHCHCEYCHDNWVEVICNNVCKLFRIGNFSFFLPCFFLENKVGSLSVYPFQSGFSSGLPVKPSSTFPN